ncbi:hypothetical protein SpCBS45565_g01316 [Spizellomyces sp. 'palustris']|nr:hypothetical protein SpCBS45565_g01316 [Spizellomyces sp. 'palustris']
MAPFLTVDTVLGPMYEVAFVNPYTAPVFWVVLSLILVPFAQIILWSTCIIFGAIPAILHMYRNRNARPINDWSKETVLITGGSHGLGKQLAETLAYKHAPKKIVVLDVRPTTFNDGSISYYECDVGDQQMVQKVAERIIREEGHPTIIINNAGIVSHALSVVDTPEEEIARVIKVNLLAQFWIAKAFLPNMRKTDHGHIVTVSSVLGSSAAAFAAAYCASKSGVTGFHEGLRQELLGTNVRMTCVYPGLIDTGMFSGMVHQRPWLTPPLKTSEVCNAIVTALEVGRSRDVFLPLYTYIAPLLRFLPIEFGDAVRQMSGANQEMLAYKYSASAT